MAATQTLPSGELVSNMAYAIDNSQPNLILRGSPDGTVIRGRGWGNYPENNSFYARGVASGYVDGIVRHATISTTKDGTILSRIELPPGLDMTYYTVGNYLDLFQYDGYGKPTGMLNTLVKITAKKDLLLTVSGPVIPDAVNSAKWYLTGTVACKNANEGNDVLNTVEPHSFKVNDIVYITCGAEDANNLDGQYRKIQRIEPNKIILFRPLSKNYHPDRCVIFKPKVVTNLTLENFTIAPSDRVDTSAAFFQSIYELTLNNINCDGVISLAGVGKVKINNCNIKALLFNAAQDVEINGGQYGFINSEESCFDHTVHDLTIAYPEYGAAGIGVDWSTKSHDLEYRNINIEGCGELNWSGWPSAPIFAFGDNIRYDNITIRYSKNGTACSVGGNNTFINRMVGDCGIYITNGQKLKAFHSKTVIWYPGVRGESAFNEGEIFENVTKLAQANPQLNLALLKEKMKHPLHMANYMRLTGPKRR